MLKNISPRIVILFASLLLIPVFGYFLWNLSAPKTLSSVTKKYTKAGSEVEQNFKLLPLLPITEDKDSYHITDTKEGLDIRFAHQEKKEPDPSTRLNLVFPKDYTKPIEVKLDDTRTITITYLAGKSAYKASTLVREKEASSSDPVIAKLPKKSVKEFFASLGSITSQNGKEVKEGEYLRYESDDQRKELLYAFEKDQATGEKKLKHWTLYRSGIGTEEESYQFGNAKVKVNEEGIAEVYFFGDQALQNEAVAKEVDSDLMARAQRTIAEEMGKDILRGNHTPDLTIPAPYYIDNAGAKHPAEWKWNEEKSILSVSFTVEQKLYPIALDPTLSFAVPGQSNAGDVITGEATNAFFGSKLLSGDFNSDGKIDLAVGAPGYTSNTGRVYLFYGGAIRTTTASSADFVFTGENASDAFGTSLASGDFNSDGNTDIAIGASGYAGGTGRVYVFYNDGEYPSVTASADVIFSGETAGDAFGTSLASGDFNSDGRTDLAVEAFHYAGDFGRVYVFYGGISFVTKSASTADVIITGASGIYFGDVLSSGDVNADGKTDLIARGYGYNSNTGRAYIFYGGSIITEGANSADVIITGEATEEYFGISFFSADFNGDGKTDLVLASAGYSNGANQGRVYIFYADGTSNFGTGLCAGTPALCNASTADVIITGEGTIDYFGSAFASADVNSDGKADLIVSAPKTSGFLPSGHIYIFYGGSIVTENASTADVIITDPAMNNAFGSALTTGDFNGDGRADIAVGSSGYLTYTGRVYTFYSQNGQINTNKNITGETSGDQFGSALTTGDFNADGNIDLAVSAPNYSGGIGRTYIFYNKGALKTVSSSTADAILTGEAGSAFGTSLASGDFNGDKKTDLIVGAPSYSSDTGRAYIFYNGAITTKNASASDVIITGEAGSYFGSALASGDFTNNGKTDFVVGGKKYSTNTGRAYTFLADGTNDFGTVACTGTAPTLCDAVNADALFTGETTGDFFGTSLASADIDLDNKADIIVGADGYTTNTGRAYVFYSTAITTRNASASDVILTGETSGDHFGSALTTGDFNTDGKTDLAVGASAYSTSAGRAYIFYNTAITTKNASLADVIITGEAGSAFGSALVSGDFNADGKTDLAVGAPAYSTDTGRAYFFYSDGTLPTTAVTADVTLTGVGTGNYFGSALAMGDINTDARMNLIVGSPSIAGTGTVYLYETRENFAWDLQLFSLAEGVSVTNTVFGQEQKITGLQNSGYFGSALASGDFNGDGKTDLLVGASGAGSIYIFYNDGLYPTNNAGADVTMTGYDGGKIAVGDFDADGTDDLAISNVVPGNTSSIGKIYILYNHGTWPVNITTADFTISAFSGVYGQTINALVSGDFNGDGRTDIIASTYGYTGGVGYFSFIRIFYNDGAYPADASLADVTISGVDHLFQLGSSLALADMDNDHTLDIVAGCISSGSIRIFYNDGTLPTTAGTADVIINSTQPGDGLGTLLTLADVNADGSMDILTTAVNHVNYDKYGSLVPSLTFSIFNGPSFPTSASLASFTLVGLNIYSMTTGDWNHDSKTDFALKYYVYSSYTPNYISGYQIAIHYNDGNYAPPDFFMPGSDGSSMLSGDFNADGYDDLVVGNSAFDANKGRVSLYMTNDKVIWGEATNNFFGSALSAGDFNADGKTDLAVGAYGNTSNTGRVYLFYNDNSWPAYASTADATISGEIAGDLFGTGITAGDFNGDGKDDLAVGATGQSTNTGAVYLFYNTGTGAYPASASARDDVIVGESANSYFGKTFTTGDYDGNGKTDLVVGAYGYSGNSGRVYAFYNDGTGIYPPTADLASQIITGESGIYFGFSLASGDFNADGTLDIASGGYGYSGGLGRAYMFYSVGGIFPSTVATANETITGVYYVNPRPTSPYFGYSLVSGDFNADGKTDLVVGAYNTGYLVYDYDICSGDCTYISGSVYMFYNDGSYPYPLSASGADVTMTQPISGLQSASHIYEVPFGHYLTSGDFNADGKTDLVVNGSYFYYNDGAYPSNATPDMSKQWSLYIFPSYPAVAGDFNADGKTDLATGVPSTHLPWPINSTDTTGYITVMITEIRTVDRFQLLRIRSGESGAPTGAIRFKGTGLSKIKIK